MKTYGQLADNINNLSDLQNKVIPMLNKIGIPNTSKTHLLIKKAYNKGYNVSDTVSFIILKSN